MARVGRLFAFVSWFVVVSLVPVPWDQLARWQPPFDLAAVAHAVGLPGGPASESVRAAPVAPPNAFPPEQVKLLSPGGPSVARVPKQTIDFSHDGGPTKGPGVVATREVGNVKQSAELRLKGVGGRQAARRGQTTVFEVAADPGRASNRYETAERATATRRGWRSSTSRSTAAARRPSCCTAGPRPTCWSIRSTSTA